MNGRVSKCLFSTVDRAILLGEIDHRASPLLKTTVSRCFGGINLNKQSSNVSCPHWFSKSIVAMFLSALPVLEPQLVQAQQTRKTSDAVLDWNDTALAAIQTLELRPPIATYCLAMAHAAIFDAVNSIIGDYQPYVAPVSAPPDASADAAAAQAGHECSWR
ncbi:MAG: hypothetical protein QOE55_1958 [Acidobacteriaceae bacterium]|nr:hypothetical protein [Acidobacteriaceae bacterium]